MNKNKIIYIIALISFVLLGIVIYMQYFKNKDALPVNNSISNNNLSNSNNFVVYSNAEFGFDFSMPDSWKGYSVVNSMWEGNPLKVTSTKQEGPKLLIRNPKWTAATPYEDIPVMIFTLKQWVSYNAEDFSVSAAPIRASEFGRNNTYVFALPPRWDFDYSQGYEEAQNIIKSSPLKTFDIKSNISGKLNIDFICQDALTYIRFKDTESLSTFTSECKAGKYPEIIEKYKSQMNVKDGATI